MNPASFRVSLTPYDDVVLAGMRISTNMAACSTDCPALWQRFMAGVSKAGGRPDARVTGTYFGLSYMTDRAAGEFDYVAAMAPSVDIPAPKGTESITLPAGLYARVDVPSLEQLGNAYAYIYTVWLAGQSGYASNPAAPCFELFDERFLQSGEFELYVPLRKK